LGNLMDTKGIGHLRPYNQDWIMFEFSFWALALGTAPLALAALWNQIGWQRRQVAQSGGNAHSVVLDAIVIGRPRCSR
jgi:hypothetical protein